MNDLVRRLIGRLPPPLRERLRGLPPDRTALVAILTVAFVVALVTGEDEPAHPPAPPSQQATSKLPPGVAGAMKRMSPSDKVAQLFLWGFEGTDPSAKIFADMRRTKIGGLVPASRNYRDRAQLERLADEASAVARRAKSAPPWFIAMQAGGEFSAFGDIPPSKPPADIGSPPDAAKEAEDSAKELRSIGVNGVLGPLLDIASEEGGSLEAQTYSDIPEEVTVYARETVAAYGRANVFAAAQHFPGLGAAALSPEVGPAMVGLSEEELEQRDLRPFRAAIASGVPGIVVGNGLYATDDFVTPASVSHAVVTRLLRDELGFDGLAIADDLSQPGVTATLSVPDAAVEAIKAGEDMVYIDGPASDQEAAHSAVVKALREGVISMERIDDALLRVLTAKSEAGLLK